MQSAGGLIASQPVLILLTTGNSRALCATSTSSAVVCSRSSADNHQSKLNDGAYSNLTAVESDFKRMISNAKSFNDKASSIYADAERVRKTASNFMVKYNPAYRNPHYVAVATPLPDESPLTPLPHLPHSNQPTPPAPSTAKMPVTTRSGRNSLVPTKQESAAASPAPLASLPTAPRNRYSGKTMQQAQQQIVEELIEYTEYVVFSSCTPKKLHLTPFRADLEIFYPFANLPSRELKDYYKVITHPVSLKAVLKRVKGIHGRNAPTGSSDFPTWDEFYTEVSYIWENARTYNEDGSEMFDLASDFEVRWLIVVK
jgi:hypothetical protein